MAHVKVKLNKSIDQSPINDLLLWLFWYPRAISYHRKAKFSRLSHTLIWYYRLARKTLSRSRIWRRAVQFSTFSMALSNWVKLHGVDKSESWGRYNKSWSSNRCELTFGRLMGASSTVVCKLMKLLASALTEGSAGRTSSSITALLTIIGSL